MTLNIEDLGGSRRVTTETEVELALHQRYVAGIHEPTPSYAEGVNEFWISHADDRYPVLAIVVNGDLASLTYFPEEGHPGYKSQGDLEELNDDDDTVFHTSTPQEQLLVANHAVVRVAVAMAAAKEFLKARALPAGVEWFEL